MRRTRIRTWAPRRWSKLPIIRAPSRSANAGSIIITISRIARRPGIDAARDTGLPLVVHTREAEADTAEILGTAVKRGGVTGVLHCFTGSAELARKGLDLGFYVSLSGIVTFKNAQDLQDIAKWLPGDRMLVETDAPFLAPVPHRGRKCEPAFVVDTAAFLADLREEDPEQLADATTANFFRLFGKARG
jgi:TatD DNase family protein